MADTVTLRNGSVLRVVPLAQPDIRQLFESFAAGDSPGMIAVIARAVPDATQADLYCIMAFPDDAQKILRASVDGFGAPQSFGGLLH